MVRKWMAVIILAAVAAGFCVLRLAEAKKRVIDYLPQEYSMDTKILRPTLPIALSQVVCKSAPEAEDYYTCLDCASLRVACPDCCFVADKPAEGQQRCVAGDPDFCDVNDPAAPFSCPKTCVDDSCSASPAVDCAKLEPASRGQREGCPSSARPNDPSCVEDPAGGIWYCLKDHLSLPDSCSPNRDARVSRKCSDIRPVYEDIKELEIENDPLLQRLFADSKAKTCYRYEPSERLRDCIRGCTEAADLWENCRAKQTCCERRICANKGKQTCPSQPCGQRVSFGCDTTYNTQECTKIMSLYDSWLLEGRSSDCFRPVSDQGREFAYEIVPYSNEQITLIWQMLCTSKVTKVAPGKQRNFYSMIKIFDAENGKQVHTSIIHQRSFESTFFVNASTVFKVNTQEQVGRKYKAVIYYYIPERKDENLAMEVSFLQFIVHRNRQ